MVHGSGRAGRTDIRLHAPEWSSLWRASIRLVDRYRAGRVFLAGDAAHIHTLLSFGAATPQVGASPPDLRTLHVVGQPAGPGGIADSEGHLASAYGAADRILVLIRPDGYVALISDAGDVSAVSHYLAAIG